MINWKTSIHKTVASVFSNFLLEIINYTLVLCSPDKLNRNWDDVSSVKSMKRFSPVSICITEYFVVFMLNINVLPTFHFNKFMFRPFISYNVKFSFKSNICFIESSLLASYLIWSTSTHKIYYILEIYISNPSYMLKTTLFGWKFIRLS